MTGASAGGGALDIEDVDALVTDRYLDSILAAHARGADHGPIAAGALLDPAVELAARRIALELPRLHPSFRFEDALALKLGEAAARMRLAGAPGGAREIDPPAMIGRIPPPGTNRDDRFGLRPDPRIAGRRPLLIGGALTSAALSLAGAAYVAWRIRHPQSSPMARAVRSAGRTRLA